MVACRSGLTVPSPGCAPPAEGLRQCLRRAARRQLLLSSAQRLAIADLRFAAWFLWMTPLLAALSRLCDAACIATVAASTSPASAASRNLRTAVFSDDLTALLRWRAFSFCLLRLIWDLIFATRKPRSGSGSHRWARADLAPRQPHILDREATLRRGRISQPRRPAQTSSQSAC